MKSSKHQYRCTTRACDSHAFTPPNRLLAALALSVVSLTALSVPSAQAASASWIGATSGTWGTNTNWSSLATPDSTSDLTIAGPLGVAGTALDVNIAASATANSISFTNTATTTLTNTTSGSNQTLTLGSGGLTTGLGAVVIGSTTANQNVNVALSANQTWNVGAGNMTVNNVVSGAGIALIKSGTGTVSFLGANTYSGGITVNAGIVDIQNNAALGTGTATLAGGTLQASGAADRTITNNIVAQSGTTSTLNTNGRNLTINGNISGSGNINRGAPGTATGVILGGDDSAFTGTFTQNAAANATVRFSNANAGSAGASWVFQNTTAGRTTLDFAGTGTISFGSMTGGGSLQANVSGTKTISAGALGLNDTFSGILAVNGANILAFTKTGVGTMTLSGTSSSYTGITTISGGTLSVTLLANGGSNSSIGASTNVAGNLILNGGALKYTGTGASTDRLFSLQSSSTIDASGTGALNLTNAGAMGFNGGTAAKTLTLTGTNTGANTLAAIVGDNTGATSLTKSGAGNWTLSGASTYTGATTVNAGALKAGVASVANTSGAFGNNSAVTMANVAGATLDITGFNTQIGSLAGGGTTGGNVTLGAATLTTGGDNTSPAAYAGVISGSGGAFTKIGTGTQILSGANTYTGTTTVTAGTLLVNGSLAAGSAVSVTAGTLGGAGNGTTTGLIGGATVLSAGAKLSPGTSAGLIGNLTFSNGLNLSASSNDTGAYIFNLDTVAASDKITLTSVTANALNVGTLDAADFTFTTGGGFGTGVYVLFDANSTIAGSIGTASVDFGGGITGTLSIDGVNNDVLLTVVPEPSTILLSGLGLAAMLWRIRRVRA